MRIRDLFDLFIFRLKNNLFRFFTILVTTTILVYLIYSALNLQLVLKSEFQRYTEETYCLEGSIWEFSHGTEADGVAPQITLQDYYIIQESIKNVSSQFSLYTYPMADGNFYAPNFPEINFRIHLYDSKETMDLRIDRNSKLADKDIAIVYINGPLYSVLKSVGHDLGDTLIVRSDIGEFSVIIQGVHNYDSYQVMMNMEFALANNINIKHIAYHELGSYKNIEEIKYIQNKIFQETNDNLKVFSSIIHKMDSFDNYYLISTIIINIIFVILAVTLIALSYNNIRFLMEEEKQSFSLYMILGLKTYIVILEKFFLLLINTLISLFASIIFLIVADTFIAEIAKKLYYHKLISSFKTDWMFKYQNHWGILFEIYGLYFSIIIIFVLKRIKDSEKNCLMLYKEE